MSVAIIQAQQLRKEYLSPAGNFLALKGIDLEVRAGEFVAIMGPSGSGKSTLMNLLGCLDQATSGRYLLNGTEIAGLDDNQLADLRNRAIGFVFQSYNLLPRLTVGANVALPLVYAGVRAAERQKRARQILEQLGLANYFLTYPPRLSGGQQQRVAIARALVQRPALVLADEPTGNLDLATGNDILALLSRLNAENGVTIVMVTHDANVARRARRLIRIVDGNKAFDGAVMDDAA